MGYELDLIQGREIRPEPGQSATIDSTQLINSSDSIIVIINPGMLLLSSSLPDSYYPIASSHEMSHLERCIRPTMTHAMIWEGKGKQPYDESMIHPDPA